MKELYILNTIIDNNGFMKELDFLEDYHFQKYGNEYRQIRDIYFTTGEISLEDLVLFKIHTLKRDDFNIYLPSKALLMAYRLFDEYQLRKGKELIKSVQNTEIIDEFRNKVKDIISQIDNDYKKTKPDTTLSELVPKVLENAVRMRNQGGQVGIRLKSLPSMNKAIGGIVPGDLIGIYGKEKSTKTTLALEMMLDICVSQKIPGAIFSYEMDNDLMAMKSISLRTGLPINAMRSPDKDYLNDLDFEYYKTAAVDKFAESQLYMIDTILDEVEIESRVRRLKEIADIKIIMIDYLLLIFPRERFGNTRERINYLTAFFKRLAKKLDIAIILISQANDSGEREAEGKGLSRDSNYYFYVAKIEPHQTIKIGNVSYTSSDTEEYLVKNRGIRHASGGRWFIMKFYNNKYVEVTTDGSYNNFNS